MIRYAIHGKIPSGLSGSSLPRIAREISRVRRRYETGAYIAGLSFVSSNRIRALNHAYRGINRPTDVLSFSADEGTAFPVCRSRGEAEELGDIFICPAVAASQAKREKIDVREELIRLIIHGTLHTMGYDHADPRAERNMFRHQESVLSRVFRTATL